MAIICSSEDEGRSHIVAQLQNYRRPYSAMSSKTDFKEYLQYHFKRLPEVVAKEEDVASVVDPDRSVFIIKYRLKKLVYRVTLKKNMAAAVDVCFVTSLSEPHVVRFVGCHVLIIIQGIYVGVAL